MADRRAGHASVLGAVEEPAKPLSTAKVLRREFRGNLGAALKRSFSLQAYCDAALQKNQAALCLSGGGVRSAAFGLGVIEALAGKGLLTKFHYVSTVSGGGFIGGFITRWIKATKGDVATVERALKNAATPGVPEPRQIEWLREYSNYLTPRTGIASTDTWAAAVLWVRNTLINWFVFVPFFLIAAGIPNLYLALLRAMPDGYAPALLLLCLLLVAVATYFTGRDLPSHAAKRFDGNQVFWIVAVPSLVSSFLLTLAIAPAVFRTNSPSFAVLGVGTPLAAGAVMTVGLIAGYIMAGVATKHPAFLRNSWIWAIGAAISGLSVWLGIHIAQSSVVPDVAWHEGIFAALAPLWIVISQLLLVIYYTAFRRVREKDGLSPDLDREWLGRLSALKLKCAVLTAIYSALVLVGPLLFFANLGCDQGVADHRGRRRLGADRGARRKVRPERQRHGERVAAGPDDGPHRHPCGTGFHRAPDDRVLRDGEEACGPRRRRPRRPLHYDL